jgi:hypothetical protein
MLLASVWARTHNLILDLDRVAEIGRRVELGLPAREAGLDVADLLEPVAVVLPELLDAAVQRVRLSLERLDALVRRRDAAQRLRHRRLRALPPLLERARLLLERGLERERGLLPLAQPAHTRDPRFLQGLDRVERVARAPVLDERNRELEERDLHAVLARAGGLAAQRTSCSSCWRCRKRSTSRSSSSLRSLSVFSRSWSLASFCDARQSPPRLTRSKVTSSSSRSSLPDSMSVLCHSVRRSSPAARCVSRSSCCEFIRANSATLSCGKNELECHQC